jgi:mycothiol synthase
MSTPLASVPQLRMGYRGLATLQAPRLPPGYDLRTFQPGDEEAWIALLNTGDFGEWDRVRLDRMLAGERASIPHDGIFFATHQGQSVGAACTFLYPDAAELGWVVVHPDHRGYGLSLQLCRAVLAFSQARGYDYVYLKTEDFRLAAIKTYLRVGFEPEMVDPAHPAWWAAARHALMA